MPDDRREKDKDDGLSPEEQGLFRRFLRNWAEDQDEGITLRVVHNRVHGLQLRYDDEMRKHHGRISALEANRRRDAEDRRNGMTPAHGVQVPPGLSINVGSASGAVGTGASSARGSLGPKASAILTPGVIRILLVAIAALLGAVAHAVTAGVIPH
jgi:hypothetical protein